MISRRAKFMMRSDLTQFFSSFFREYEQKAPNGSYDLSIGNVCGIPVVQDVLQDALLTVGKNVHRLTKYPGTQGYFPLNQKIAELIKKETKKEVTPEEIILTNGAFDGLFQLFHTFCDPGDYFYYCAPSFPYWSSADKSGVKSSVVVYKNPFDYAQTYGSIFQKKVEVNKRIKLAIVNEPHNPIGKSLEPEQVKILRDTADESGVQVILDEVYRSFAPDKRWIGESFDDSAIMVDSFSKRFGMPGLRLGFIRAPKDVVPFIRAGMANQVVGLNMVTALVADSVLDVALTTNFTKVISREIARRQNQLDKSLRKMSHGIVSHMPDGGIYRLLALQDMDATQLSQKLGEHHVKTVPGKLRGIHIL